MPLLESLSRLRPAIIFFRDRSAVIQNRAGIFVSEKEIMKALRKLLDI